MSRELTKKKLCFLWLYFPTLPFIGSFTPGSTWKIRGGGGRGRVADIRRQFCFDSFFHWFHTRLSCSSVHCLFIYSSIHPSSKFLLSPYCVCQVGFKMPSLQGRTRLMRSLSSRNLRTSQGRELCTLKSGTKMYALNNKNQVSDRVVVKVWGGGGQRLL